MTAAPFSGRGWLDLTRTFLGNWGVEQSGPLRMSARIHTGEDDEDSDDDDNINDDGQCRTRLSRAVTERPRYK